MKPFRYFRVLPLLVLSWITSQPAQAATPQAGQLTYTYVSTAANGEQTYRVQAEVFASCGGALPATLPLEAVQTCGGPPRTATLSQPIAPIPQMPYCPRVQAQVQCPQPAGATTPEGFVGYFYEGTIALPPAAEWVLSVEAGARPVTANLVGNPMLRLEATLHSLIQPAGGAPIVVTNNSARLSPNYLPLVLVFPQQESTISFGASDSDRTNSQADSLGYTLESTRIACNVVVSYASYPGTCASTIDPHCPLRLINCQGLSNYSPTLPLAVQADTVFENGNTRRPPCPTSIVAATVRPQFTFNPSSGSFTFTPIAYQPGATALGLNKYVVTAQVTEYRKLNGTYYPVGTVRREFMVVLVPPALYSISRPPRLLPGPTSAPFGRDTLDLSVYSCEYTRFHYQVLDPDNSGLPAGVPLQNVQVFYPADVNTNLLDGGNIGQFYLSGNGTPTPGIDLYLQPVRTAAGTTVFIPLRLEDDDCPAKGVSFKVLRLTIRPNPNPLQVLVAGQATPHATVCPGTSVTLSGHTLRSDSVRNIATGQTTLQQHGYQWSAPGASPATSGLPAATNTAAIVVSPTATTRYLLTVTPGLGFGPGVCRDTLSTTIYVPGPAAVPTITRTGNLLTSNFPTGNQWYVNGQPIAGATGQTYLAPAPGTYTVQVTSNGAPSCTSAPSAALIITTLGNAAARPGPSLTIAPNPTADGRVRVALTGYAQAVSLRVYDMLGRVVQQQQVSAPNPAGTVRELDLSAQPAGVYLLQVQTRGGMDVRRIVRQ